jgi:hypothetical protein
MKTMIKRFQKLMPEELITSLYRMIVKNNLQITTKVVNVKKGKIKYTLVIIKDRELKTVFNIGRHFDQAPVISLR